MLSNQQRLSVFKGTQDSGDRHQGGQVGAAHASGATEGGTQRLPPPRPSEAAGPGRPESEGRWEWRASRLNGFLRPSSLPCLVSLGGVYSGALGEGVGLEEERVQSSPKEPRSVSQEREKEEGEPIPG